MLTFFIATEAAKRPKLHNENSAGSSGHESSTASQHEGEIHIGHGRVGSVSSSGPTWLQGDLSPSASTSQLPSLANLSAAHGIPTAGRGQGSPNNIGNNPHVLPGYRDSIYGTNQQTVAWRENTHDTEGPQSQQLPRIMNMADRRSGYFGTGPSQGHIGLNSQSSVRSNLSEPPPLLSSESTSGTTNSSMSGSSNFYPRTPLEPPLERSLPITQLYSSKPTSQYDNQLPPFRTSSSSSVSPQTNTAAFNPSSSKLFLSPIHLNWVLFRRLQKYYLHGLT
jgi:hypothetical protein